MKKLAILTALSPAIILLSAIIKIPRTDVWYVQNVALLLILFLFASIVLWGFNKYLAIFLTVCSLSTFFVSQLTPRAIILIFHLTLGCLASYGISRLKGKEYRYIIWGLLLLTLIQFSLLVLQSFNIDPFFHSLLMAGKKETVGFSGSRDQLGTLFALTAPVLAYFSPWLSIISFIGIGFSKSSFALVAGFTSILLYWFLVNKNIFKKVLFVVMLSSILFFTKVDKISFADFNVRSEVWKYAANSVIKGNIGINKFGQNLIVKTNSLFGYGFGSFLVIFPYVPQKNNFNYIDEKFTHSHNDYVELFFELGYIGAIATLSLLLSFLIGFTKAIKSRELVLFFCCLIAYLLNACGNFISHLAVSGVLLIIFYGCYMGILTENRRMYGKVAATSTRANA